MEFHKDHLWTVEEVTDILSNAQDAVDRSTVDTALRPVAFEKAVALLSQANVTASGLAVPRGVLQ